MSDSVSLAGLLVALFLPWLCGCIWINWLLRRTGRWNAFVVLGQGFFLGMVFITAAIRLWDLAGLGLSFWGIAAVLCSVAVFGLVLQRLQSKPVVQHRYAEPIPVWHIAVGLFLVALIAWRHVILCQESLLRPLYAWDAWMNWAPKAIAWFHHGALVDFVQPEEWLRRSGTEVYLLGNPSATSYPIAVPLIQLWTMLGLGIWDQGAVYLPWILAPVSLGLGLFGHLRLAGVPFLLSVIACYLLLSLPFLNVHTVLAGYADIWLAAAFGLAVCALHEWRRGRHWAYAVLWILLALFCCQIKALGMVLALIILASGAQARIELSNRWVTAIGLIGGLIALALALVLGVDIELPLLGHIHLDAGVVELGKLGQFELAYHPVGAAFLETGFVMINWHLLWYLVLPYVAYRIYRDGRVGLPNAEVLAVAMAAAFVGLVFVFSEYYVSALDFVALNRVLLYLIPALIFCIFLCFQRER